MTALNVYSLKKRAGDRSRIQFLLTNKKNLAPAILGQLSDDFYDAEQIMVEIDDLAQLVSRMSPPDLADTLEGLPSEERHALWRLVSEDKRGQVLLEASETVWGSLIDEMSDRDLLCALSTLDIDEQIYLAQYLPRDLTGRLTASLPPLEREQVHQVLHYPKGTVGSLMEFGIIIVRPAMTLGAVQRYLRRLGKMPDNTDKLFVTSRNNQLVGELDVTALLLNRPQKRVDEVMNKNPVTLEPDDDDEEAARTFERDNLISAAVIDADGRLLGRVTIDEIVDVVYEETDNDLRRMGGVSAGEDIFAPVVKALKTRWAWLAVNLCTAFIASRVIDGFEHTISQLVALASLMPIVAGIGGNTGNQTITMIVRAQAMHTLQPGSVKFLLGRELGVALVNGLIWGGLMGGVTWILYHDMALGAVMTLAMVLNLLVAALMGVIIPTTMARLGRDPAVGSSVMITAITDTGGFFIFLGLATLFLV